MNFWIQLYQVVSKADLDVRGLFQVLPQPQPLFWSKRYYNLSTHYIHRVGYLASVNLETSLYVCFYSLPKLVSLYKSITGFDRYKGEERKGKHPEEKKNPGIDTIEIWFPVTAACPHLWRVRGTSCLLRSAGGGFSPLKGLPGYHHVFLPHSLPVKQALIHCVLRALSTIGIQAFDLTCREWAHRVEN